MKRSEIKTRIESIIENLQCIADHTESTPMYDIICSTGAVRSRLEILLEKLERMNEESIDEVLGVKQGQIPIGEMQDQQLYDAIGVDDWQYWDCQ